MQRRRLPQLSGAELERADFGVAVVRCVGGALVLETANRAYLAGLPRDLRDGDVFGRRVDDFLPSDVLAEAKATIAEARRHGSAFRPVVRVAFPGQDTRFYRWTVVSHTDEPDVVTFVIFNVTDAVRTRELADVRHAEQAAVLETLRDAVLLLDADRTIRWVNPAARRLLGSKLVGESWREVRDRIGFMRLDGIRQSLSVELALDGQQPEPVDVRFAVDGREVICRGGAHPVRVHGEVIGAAVVLADATEERRLARERNALLERELHVHEQVRSEVAAALHDGVLQTLAELSVMIEAVHARGEPLRGESLYGLIDRAVTEARRATEELQPPVEQGVSVALARLARDWRERGLLDVRVEGTPLPRLERWQETQLYRVAAEAMHNALKHATGSTVRVVQRLEPDRIVIEITDTGPGATEHQRRAAAQAGHLGVILSHERMAALGGAYMLHSVPGQGSTVTLTLPRASAGSPPP